MGKSISIEDSQALKGFAILAVIIQHANSWNLLGDSIPIEWTTIFCEIGMGLFLFLSGYGLYKSYLSHGLKGYWGKKILKVYLPFLFCQCILLTKMLIIDSGSDIKLLEVLKSMSGIANNNMFDPTMWYISYQIFLYVIFFFIFLIFKDQGTIITMLLLAIALFFVTQRVWFNGYYCSILFPAGVFYSHIEDKYTMSFSKIPHKYRYIFFAVYLVGEFRKTRIKSGAIFMGKISFMLYLIELKFTLNLSVLINNKITLVAMVPCLALVIAMAISIPIAYYMEICSNRVTKYILKK